MTVPFNIRLSVVLALLAACAATAETTPPPGAVVVDPQPPAASPAEEKPKAAAYYFPSWHRPSKEHTGPNFAEWGCVAHATPRFPGHQQPKHPVWGIEDEADPKVMAKKIAAAADHALSAFIFCWYYHEQGGYLEPEASTGMKYLEAVRDVFGTSPAEASEDVNHPARTKQP